MSRLVLMLCILYAVRSEDLNKTSESFAHFGDQQSVPSEDSEIIVAEDTSIFPVQHQDIHRVREGSLVLSRSYLPPADGSLLPSGSGLVPRPSSNLESILHSKIEEDNHPNVNENVHQNRQGNRPQNQQESRHQNQQDNRSQNLLINRFVRPSTMDSRNNQIAGFDRTRGFSQNEQFEMLNFDDLARQTARNNFEGRQNGRFNDRTIGDRLNEEILGDRFAGVADGRFSGRFDDRFNERFDNRFSESVNSRHNEGLGDQFNEGIDSRLNGRVNARFGLDGRVDDQFSRVEGRFDEGMNRFNKPLDRNFDEKLDNGFNQEISGASFRRRQNENIDPRMNRLNRILNGGFTNGRENLLNEQISRNGQEELLSNDNLHQITDQFIPQESRFIEPKINLERLADTGISGSFNRGTISSFGNGIERNGRRRISTPLNIQDVIRNKQNTLPSNQIQMGYNNRRDGSTSGKPYQFEYGVRDINSGINFSRQETSDGHTTSGEYRVLLPDGRTQIVKYTANKRDGYNADVRYEGGSTNTPTSFSNFETSSNAANFDDGFNPGAAATQGSGSRFQSTSGIFPEESMPYGYRGKNMPNNNQRGNFDVTLERPQLHI